LGYRKGGYSLLPAAWSAKEKSAPLAQGERRTAHDIGRTFGTLLESPRSEQFVIEMSHNQACQHLRDAFQAANI
jgi:hypothetical protein